MTLKIESVNAIKPVQHTSPEKSDVTDLNQRLASSTHAQINSATSVNTDWNKEAIKILMKNFSDAMYDPESDIYIGEKDIF